MTEQHTLIVMRLADMARVHPEQITGSCARCGHEVGIYPSGQSVVRQHPDIEIVCHVCAPAGIGLLAPGAEHEPRQSRPRRST